MSEPLAPASEPRHSATPEPPASATAAVRAEPVTAEAFRPFGAVIERPRAVADASGDGWSWWARAAALPPDDRPLAVGYLALDLALSAAVLLPDGTGAEDTVVARFPDKTIEV